MSGYRLNVFSRECPALRVETSSPVTSSTTFVDSKFESGRFLILSSPKSGSGLVECISGIRSK
jgi:hypothetical protein